MRVGICVFLFHKAGVEERRKKERMATTETNGVAEGGGGVMEVVLEFT